MKGLLANLITIRDVSYATGLEVVAGGRLYNIVVDTEVGLLKGSVHVFYVILFPVFLCNHCTLHVIVHWSMSQ